MPHQRLGLAEAVAAFTTGSAHINHDDEAGRIEVGARADLAIVDRDIFADDAGPVADAAVVVTLASGQIVYER